MANEIQKELAAIRKLVAKTEDLICEDRDKWKRIYPTYTAIYKKIFELMKLNSEKGEVK